MKSHFHVQCNRLSQDPDWRISPSYPFPHHCTRQFHETLLISQVLSKFSWSLHVRHMNFMDVASPTFSSCSLIVGELCHTGGVSCSSTSVATDVIGSLNRLPWNFLFFDQPEFCFLIWHCRAFHLTDINFNIITNYKIWLQLNGKGCTFLYFQESLVLELQAFVDLTSTLSGFFLATALMSKLSDNNSHAVITAIVCWVHWHLWEFTLSLGHCHLFALVFGESWFMSRFQQLLQYSHRETCHRHVHTPGTAAAVPVRSEWLVPQTRRMFKLTLNISHHFTYLSYSGTPQSCPTRAASSLHYCIPCGRAHTTSRAPLRLESNSQTFCFLVS